MCLQVLPKLKRKLEYYNQVLACLSMTDPQRIADLDIFPMDKKLQTYLSHAICKWFKGLTL